MDIYSLLELLVRSARLAEPIEHDALELIEQLRRINAFGNATAATSVIDHAPAGITYLNRVCTYCHKEHEE